METERSGPGDGCTFAPDVIMGVELTPYCDDHDVSKLDLDAHVALGAAILAGFIAAWRKRSWMARKASYIIGGVVGATYTAATTAYWLVRYRIWGRRK